jgi:hypothetical protein
MGKAGRVSGLPELHRAFACYACAMGGLTRTRTRTRRLAFVALLALVLAPMSCADLSGLAGGGADASASSIDASASDATAADSRSDSGSVADAPSDADAATGPRFLYALGGVPGGAGGMTAEVLSATIAPDGSLGSWTTRARWDRGRATRRCSRRS